mgnify:CR=1 FL=1
MKASTCDFGDQLDSLIRDQIVACCRSSKLRLKLLQVANISLKDTLETARSLETANRQTEAIENNNHGVGPSPELATLGGSYRPPEHSNPRRSQRPKRSGNEPEWAQRKREQKFQTPCYRCGELGHRTCEKARGKTCSRCGKKNHLAKACESAPPSPLARVHGLDMTTPQDAAALSDAQADSSDREVFCIHPLSSAGNDAQVAVSLNSVPCCWSTREPVLTFSR